MSETDPIPTIRHSTSPHALTVEEVVDALVIRVDRLQQGNKLLKWVASTGLALALGGALTVARMLYGMGADDATTSARIDRAQRLADDNHVDIKELQRAIFSRRYPAAATSSGSGWLAPPAPMIENKEAP